MSGTLLTAYLAGFFDGEGCVYAHPSSAYIQIDVSQRIKAPLELFRQEYGGKLRPGHENLWRWACPAASLERFLLDMLPYLVVKREQVEWALEFRAVKKGVKHGKCTDAERVVRLDLARRIKAAKKT